MDDRQLLTALTGSQRDTAMAECIRRFGPMVRRTAWRITGDEHLADDVCQAVFLVLARKAATLANDRSPAAWLHHVAVMTARNVVKADARRRRREQEAGMVARSRREPMPLPTGIDEAINRLPTVYRQVLVAHYLEGRSHREIAGQLGVSEELVRKRASLGIDRLRRRLAAAAPGITVVGLTAALSAEASAAAATSVPAAAIQAAVAGQAAGVSVLADGVIKALFWAKAKVYAAVAAGMLVVGGAVVVQVLSADSDRGLVGHYNFDEGSGLQAADLAGSNHGTLVNGPTWANGKIGGGCRLDGVDDHVRIPDSPSLSITGDLTIAAWVKFDTLPSAGSGRYPRIVQKGNAASSATYYLAVDTMTPGDKLEFRVVIGGVAWNARSDRALTAGTWYHVAGVRRDSEAMVYVNGIRDGSIVSVPPQPIAVNREPLFIGESPGNTDGAFSGLLDDLRIYNRALSDSEIAALAQSR